MADEKKYTTEWSFSFAELGDKISDFVKSMGSEEAVRTEHISAALDGATAAKVRIDIPAAESTIKALAASEALIEGDLSYIGEIKFAVTGEAEKEVHLSQQTNAGEWMRHVFTWVGNRDHLKWNIGLTPAIPLDLHINAGVGEANFDLRDLKLTGLDINGGAGKVEITLPAAGGSYTSLINSGVGEFDITVPGNATADLKIRAGTGEFDLNIGAGAAVNADIKGGVGEFNVHIPQGAAVRVKANVGIGDVTVPSHFVRTGGSGEFISKSGVWQTPDYETAARKITINFDGGIGELKVR